jgi:alanyl-tRNA synthetase
VLGAAKMGTAVISEVNGERNVAYPGAQVVLIATVAKEHQAKVQAGKIIQTIAPIVGGKGGGKPEGARGGGKDPAKLDEALAQAKALLG